MAEPTATWSTFHVVSQSCTGEFPYWISNAPLLWQREQKKSKAVWSICLSALLNAWSLGRTTTSGEVEE